MGRKKLLVTAWFCCMLLISIVWTDKVYAAAPALSASADAGSVTEGDYVNVKVEIGNNPAISTLGATLSYDSSVLKYDSSIWNSGFSGSDMQMASDTGSEVNLSVVCDDSYEADGTIVTVRFQAVKDTSSIPVTLSLRDIADADLAAISDCQVESTVRAPQDVKETEHKNDGNESNSNVSNETIDLQNPDEALDIQIEDELSRSDGQEEPSQITVSDTTESAQNDLTVSSNLPQSVSNMDSSTRTAETSETVQAQASRPDLSYQTGNGIGRDALLIAAAACGIIALILAVRLHKEEK